MTNIDNFSFTDLWPKRFLALIVIFKVFDKTKDEDEDEEDSNGEQYKTQDLNGWYNLGYTAITL